MVFEKVRRGRQARYMGIYRCLCCLNASAIEEEGVMATFTEKSSLPV
jgi:hypothetical protein